MRTIGPTVLGAVSLLLIPSVCFAQSIGGIGVGNWLTVSANVDTGYRQTQFFEPSHDASLLQWDGRLEIWLPPFQDRFSWGPYVRLAGIASSGGEAWENAWLGLPGAGFQVFPASISALRRPHNVVGEILGPLRLFAEFNVIDYWGPENTWRPVRQVRAGLDYWKALNVNSLAHPWWTEVWNGVFWQSSNEFTSHYDSVVIGNSVRLGFRQPGVRAVSSFSPYLAAESSWTQNADYYWENHLLVGGGIRFAPSLVRSTGESHAWISRIVVYGEYLDTLRYYGVVPASAIPRYDFRVGISTNVGQWYR